MNDTREPAYEIVSDEELAQEARSFPGRTHTPGPWEIIYPGGNGYSPQIFIRKADRGGVYVAHVTVSRSDWEDNKAEINANLSLIAAAPALLAALERIEAFARAAASGYGDDPDTDVAIIAAQARAAIAQAKGEAS